ncbi:MAG: hypothetical protein BAJALOKI2v1_360016 [Promethearchaeota archaeon]|nr:MAG: hypothetical protein BAJALOKI2v1_360016 [Candidatus Lokiarchaeota archaeon]
MSDLKCGVAKRSINPPDNIEDIYIAGYLAMEAPKVDGVHDSIYTRTIVLSDKEKRVALISVECVGLLADFVNKVKERLEAYGFEKRNIFIFSTHTHAGPDTMGLWGPLIGVSGKNKRYMNFLSDSIESAVLEAIDSQVSVEIYLSKGKIENLIENYRDPQNVNPDLKILKFMSGDKLLGSLWTYSAQPEMTTRENLSISGDYCGIVCRMMEEEFGGLSLFALGLCGAQSPIYVEQGFDKMESFAEEIFSKIKQIFPDHEKIEARSLEVRERKVKLKLDNPDFELLFQIGIFERELEDNYSNSTISKLRIGKLHIIHIPGEPFPELFSKAIKEHQDKELMFISLSNDALGYFIPKDQFKLKTKQFVNEEKQEKFIGHELESIGLEASQVVRNTVENILRYKTVMAVGCHADDLSIWAGGTLAKLASEGNKMIYVRITDDYGDAVGVTKETAIKRNRKESELAYRTLGADEIIHMDYPTDTLAGVDYLELRGKLVHLMRKYKPDLVITFDLNGTDEENMDHIITARAVNEACWQSAVELFYPEHLEEDLDIHMVGERWLFARNPTIINHVIDITPWVDQKIQAITKHRLVMKNWFYQHKLIARANNLYIELLEEDVPNAIRVNLLVKVMYGEIGKEYGLQYAEIFNRVGPGFLEDLAED